MSTVLLKISKYHSEYQYQHLTVQDSPNLLKWVQALESGEYQQTTQVLTKVAEHFVDEDDPIDAPSGEKVEHEIIGHCCLGVACEVAIKAGIELKTEFSGVSTGNGAYNNVKTYDGSETNLGRSMLAWLGFDVSGFPENTGPNDYPPVMVYHPTVNKNEEQFYNFSLTSMNDSRNFTFEQIAAYIRAYGILLSKGD